MSQRQNEQHGPLELDCYMGTFNLQKGKGHVRLLQGRCPTKLPENAIAVISEKIFYAAGYDKPCEENTPLRVLVVQAAHCLEVTQIIREAGEQTRTPPYEAVSPDGKWLDATYDRFSSSYQLGFCTVDGKPVLVFYATLLTAGLNRAPKGQRICVRLGTTKQGTEVIAEITRELPMEDGSVSPES